MAASLTRVQIDGFRSLRSVAFRPGRVTVLIGANGSGKSNLLSFLRMVPLLRTGSLQTFIARAGFGSALLHYGPKVTPQLSFELDFEQEAGTNRYAARLGHAAGDTLVYLDETVSFKAHGEQEFKTWSLGAGHRESRLQEAAEEAEAHTVRAVASCIARMSFFHFHDTSASSALRGTARPEDARYLRSDGSNLAAYLLALKTSDDSADKAAWRRIQSLLQRPAPFVKELAPTLVGQKGAPLVRETSRAGTHDRVRLDWLDERDELFGPHHLSDGTLRFLALITAVAQSSHRLPAFISIDEPELGLHPAALRLLLEVVKSISHHAQVVLATQSPVVLDAFDPDDVVVVERSEAETHLRRLDQKDLQAWLEDYSLSELYDKNLLGGRP